MFFFLYHVFFFFFFFFGSYSVSYGWKFSCGWGEIPLLMKEKVLVQQQENYSIALICQNLMCMEPHAFSHVHSFPSSIATTHIFIFSNHPTNLSLTLHPHHPCHSWVFSSLSLTTRGYTLHQSHAHSHPHLSTFTPTNTHFSLNFHLSYPFLSLHHIPIFHSLPIPLSFSH